MKKLFIVSGLLSLFFAGTAVYADDISAAVSQDDQSMAGTNLSSNSAKNPFTASSMDNAAPAQPQPDTAGQTADDSDSW